MTTPVEIVFVGLCSFLNLANAGTPAPAETAVILVSGGHHQEFTPHVPFIAFEKGAMKAKGIAVKAVPGSGAYEYVELQGEEITVAPASTTALKSDAGPLSHVARLPQYARVTKPVKYKQEFGSEKVRPTSAVGGYMRFTTGALSADFPTKDAWTFRNLKDWSDTTVTDRFMREVHYKVDSSDGVLTLGPLQGSSAKTATLAVTDAGSPLTIWMGSSPEADIEKHIKRVEASTYSGGTEHFLAFYDRLDQPHDTFIPFPAGWKSPVKPRTAEERFDLMFLTPDLGYCGPDGQP